MQPIFSDIGFHEHHHSGGQYNYNIRIAEMRTDFDNGLGTTQQTHKQPDDPFRHINRWKHNMLAGWEEFAYTDIDAAYSEILKQYQQIYGANFTTTTDLFTYFQTKLNLSGQNLQAHESLVGKEILYDAICKYNHGTGISLFVNGTNSLLVTDQKLGNNPVYDYVNNVIKYHNQFNGKVYTLRALSPIRNQ